nr:Cytidine and deoxycytidylate deaminase zinc-binding region [uncultured bacterium]
MSTTEYDFDWEDVVFSDKRKTLNNLQAIFIAAPRELSTARFTQLVKEYLQQGNIILGIAREPHVLGFEGQQQFRMLERKTVAAILSKVNTSKSPYKIYTLTYSQRDTKYIFDKLKLHHVVLVNGSWKYAFHTQEPYYVLTRRSIPYTMVSPFVDEREARAYEVKTFDDITEMEFAWLREPAVDLVSQESMLRAASGVAKLSFDSSFQTGVVLAKQYPDNPEQYQFLLYAFNRVVPYQTYAMHYGNSREKFFSPPNDLNHYDTVHAEVELIIKAQKNKTDLKGTTLFINLLPCPDMQPYAVRNRY